VVFCGDLLWKNHFPNLIDAATQPWISTLATLQAEHGSSSFIPGHGEIATAGDVSSFRQYLTDLRADVGRAQAEGKSGNRLVEAVLPGIQSRYGSWAFFEDYARDDILKTGDELSGHKRVPVPVSSKPPN
jgi:glyoxylase-like metal-dependent hydrolase (beta-lactamase superfamily II)